MIDEMTFLQWIIDSDTTPRYEYGQANTKGELPGKGERFLTPKELAKERMRGILNKEKNVSESEEK